MPKTPKILLDTNVIIYRETDRILNKNTPDLFKWLEKLHYDKYIHPLTKLEISKFGNTTLRDAILAKLETYQEVSPLAELDQRILNIIAQDKDENSVIDSKILNELLCEHVDYLITQDKQMYKKAISLGLVDKVYSIERFSEKLRSENPRLNNYDVLSVVKEKFADIDVTSKFFNSLKDDYPNFEVWFKKKYQEEAYICRDNGEIKAFLYLKKEDESEPYQIEPIFKPKKRLKIGTFKVEMTGLKLGERFIKIICENAIKLAVDEIYVTIFDKGEPQKYLISLLKNFGFSYWGRKVDSNELVYIRSMAKQFNLDDPRKSFPYISKTTNNFIVPIWPNYHTKLLPDSILKNEKTNEYRDNKPHMNAIVKVYISRSLNRNLKRGDNIVFYRTSPKGSNAYHTSVITTIGIVKDIYDNINSLSEFKSICRKKSVMTEKELEEFWFYPSRLKPFVVEFLYVYSFSTPKINLSQLISNGIITDIYSVPRGFEPLTQKQMSKVLEITRSDESFIVD